MSLREILRSSALLDWITNETLGRNLTTIAEQKAGIFKPGRPAVIGPLPEEARLVCEQRAQELRIELYQYGRDFSLTNQTFF